MDGVRVAVVVQGRAGIDGRRLAGEHKVVRLRQVRRARDAPAAGGGRAPAR